MAYSAAGLDHWSKPPLWAVRGVCTALAQLAPICDEQHEGPSDCDHDQFHGFLPRVVPARNAQIAAEVAQRTGSTEPSSRRVRAQDAAGIAVERGIYGTGRRG